MKVGNAGVRLRPFIARPGAKLRSMIAAKDVLDNGGGPRHQIAGTVFDRYASQLDLSLSVSHSAAEEPMVRRLAAGGRWIRTIGPPRDGRAIQDDGYQRRSRFSRCPAPRWRCSAAPCPSRARGKTRWPPVSRTWLAARSSQFRRLASIGPAMEGFFVQTRRALRVSCISSRSTIYIVTRAPVRRADQDRERRVAIPVNLFSLM
jgi:hypothetical protein